MFQIEEIRTKLDNIKNKIDILLPNNILNKIRSISNKLNDPVIFYNNTLKEIIKKFIDEYKKIKRENSECNENELYSMMDAADYLVEKQLAYGREPEYAYVMARDFIFGYLILWLCKGKISINNLDFILDECLHRPLEFKNRCRTMFLMPLYTMQIFSIAIGVLSGAIYTNLNEPIQSEYEIYVPLSFLSYGFFGMWAFMLIAAIYCSIIDRKFYRHFEEKERIMLLNKSEEEN